MTRHGPSAMVGLDRPAEHRGEPMSGSRLRPYLGPVVALLVVLALGAGTVYAAIPNSNGKYYACYVKYTGAVRLINYPQGEHLQVGREAHQLECPGAARTGGTPGTRLDRRDQLGPAASDRHHEDQTSRIESAPQSVPPGSPVLRTYSLAPSVKVVGGRLLKAYGWVVVLESYPSAINSVGRSSVEQHTDSDLRAAALVAVHAVCTNPDRISGHCQDQQLQGLQEEQVRARSAGGGPSPGGASS